MDIVAVASLLPTRTHFSEHGEHAVTIITARITGTRNGAGCFPNQSMGQSSLVVDGSNYGAPPVSHPRRFFHAAFSPPRPALFFFFRRDDHDHEKTLRSQERRKSDTVALPVIYRGIADV